MKKFLIYAASLIVGIALIVFLFFCVIIFYVRGSVDPTPEQLARCNARTGAEVRARTEERISQLKSLSKEGYDAIEFEAPNAFEGKNPDTGERMAEFFLVRNGKRVSRHFAIVTCGSGIEFSTDGDYAGE